jgi:pyruvate dehydrogenase complex dihydrolipoamide acetyltransferase long form
MTTGSVAKWHVKEGQAVQPGDVLADIETDKATLAFENQEEGVVARLLVPDGVRDVPVGQPVAVMVEDPADVAAFKDFGAGGAGPAAAADQPSSSSSAPTAAAAAPTSSSSHQQHNPRLGPAVRFALHEAGLEAADVPSASGPNGILTKGDVMAAVAAGVRGGGGGGGGASGGGGAAAAAPAGPPPKAAAAAPAAAKPAPAAAPATTTTTTTTTTATHTDVPNSQVRRVIASRLLESKRTNPACYASADVDLSAVVALRKELAGAGVKISLNDCVVRAAALALRASPRANARWDAQTQQIVPQSSVDVAVAVATEGGLITPIVKGADQKSLRQVAGEVRDLAARARQNALKPEEFMGGTFTVSNLGMFGLDSFSAIINPPQGAILAVGGAREEARLVDGGQELEARPTMTATLSCDERAVDAEAAAGFLEAFAGFMARPATLLM